MAFAKTRSDGSLPLRGMTAATAVVLLLIAALAGPVAAAPEADAAALAILCDTQTGTGDFGVGTFFGTMISERDNGAAGGQVRLRAELDDLFLDPSPGPQWQITLPSGGYLPVIADGILDVQERDDAVYETSALESAATFTGNVVLEMRAAIHPGSDFVSIGFMSSTVQSGQWAYFSTRGSGGDVFPVIYTSVRDSAMTMVNVPTNISLGEMHDFRIVWAPGTLEFWVDGHLVDTRTGVSLTLPQRVALYKSFGSDSPLPVDWVRLTPYGDPIGTFESSVLDAGLAGVDWTNLAWTGTVPAGTTVAYETRSGESALPDPTWSDWAGLSGASVVSPAGRYLQYRATLTTADPKASPVIDDVTVCYTVTDVTPPLVAGVSPPDGSTDIVIGTAVTATFDEAIDPATLDAASFTLEVQGGAAVPATVSYDSTSFTATLTPAAALEFATAYVARLAATITDRDGNPLAAEESWGFTTMPPDLAAPTVTGTYPAAGVIEALATRPVTATFSEAVDPATLDTTSFTLTPQGGSPVAATVSYDAEAFTAVLDPTVDLQYATVYEARLTTGVADLAGNPLAQDEVWTFTTRLTAPMSSIATSVTDFTAGALAGTMVSEVDNGVAAGQVRLQAPMSDLFTSPTLDPIWVAARPAGYSPVIVDGILDVQERDGSLETVSAIETAQVWGPGVVLEARAKFHPGSKFIDVGFDSGTDYNGQYAWFSTAGTGDLVGQERITARVRQYDHTTVAIDTDATFGEWHVFKIVWTYGQADFYVDGVLVASHEDILMTVPMRAAFYKSNDSDTPFEIDWIRVTPYVASPGTYDSPVVDTGTPGNPWTVLEWLGNEPAGTSVSFATRTGETPAPDGTWSAWNALDENHVISPPGRYGQYRALLATDDLHTSPVIDEVQFFYDAPTDSTPPSVVVTAPADGATGVPVAGSVTATFNKALDAATLTAASFTLTPDGGEPVAATVSYDAEGFVATLVPDTLLAYETVYTGLLATTVADTVGNPLPEAYAWSFTTAAVPDTVRPTVLATVPVDGAVDVPVDSLVTAAFSEPLDPATVTAANFTLVADGGSPVPATVGWDSTGSLATLLPDTLLAYETLYTAHLATAVTDTAGNALATEYVWSFTTTVAPPDTTAPTVLATAPAADAAGVPRDAGVTATFDEAMDPAGLTTASFSLTPEGGAAVTATVGFDSTGTVATLTPDSLLAYETLYTALLTTALADTAGNALAADYTWSFTTVAVPDTIPPTVLATAPADSATGVPADAPVTATFSEPMDPATVTAATFTLVPDGGSAVPATVTVDTSGILATLAPDTLLAYETLYRAQLATAVADTSGNALVAAYSWSFTTGAAPPDTLGPVVLATVPVDGAVGVAADAVVTAAFDEPLDPATLTAASFTLTPDGGSSVPATLNYDAPGALATLTPDTLLAPSTLYTARLSTAVTDTLGNPLAAEFAWSFTSAAPPDTAAPLVVAVVPTAGALDVPVGTSVSATFDEAVDAATLTGATFTLTPEGGAAVAATVGYAPAGLTATLVPAAPLAFSTLYEARLTTAVADTSGNGLEADVVWTFTTESADLTPPVVTATEPLPGAVDIQVDAPVRATFSEAMDPATLTPLGFTLRPQGGFAIPAAVSWDAATLTATLVPSVDLQYATTYEARLAATVTDAAGNPLSGEEVWTFTTRLAAPLCTIITSTADFAAGTAAGVMVSESDHSVVGGQMRLQAAQSDLFLVPDLDPIWQVTRPSGGFTPVIVDGILDGQERDDSVFLTTSMEMAATYGAGVACEMRAMIQPGSAFTSLGFFSSTSLLQQWAYFSTRGTGDDPVPVIYTSVRGSNSVIADTPTTITLDEWHDFRIVWLPGTVEFYVDGALVDTRTSVDITLPQRLGYYKSGGSDSSLLIDWVRITPYAVAAGSFESPVQDAGEPGAAWTELAWVGTQPGGTDVTYETRTGETPAPDGSWSSWNAVAGDIVASPPGRYAQFRAALATADLATSPVVDSVKLCFEPVGLDTLAPEVLATVPAADAVDVAVDQAVTATFSEPLDPATVTAASFTLVPDGGLALPATVSWDSASATATLTPDTLLAYGTLFAAHLATAITDTAGNALAAEYVWSFTTAAEPDTTAPTVVATVPAADAVDVAVDQAVTATFSEPLDPATVTAASFTLVPDGGVALPATVSWDSASATATLTPDTLLAYGTLFAAHLATAITDTAGNALAAEYVWSFTTAAEPDTTAPTVVATVPAADAVDVAVDQPVTATFSEPLDPATVTAASFTLVPDGGAALPATVSWDSASTTATLVPDAPLDHATLYAAHLTTAITDAGGVPLAAEYVWSFTTGAAADTTAPTVVATLPAADMVDVPVDTVLVATFSEPIDPATLTVASFTLVDGGGFPVAATVSYDSLGFTATLVPDAPLAIRTTYTATLTAAITDTMGLALAEDHVWSFTTVQGISGVEGSGVPTVTALQANYPNPFNPRTTVAFDVARAGQVRLRIYSVDGRLVRTLVAQSMPVGRHTVVWNGDDDAGRSVATGVYLLRMETADVAQTRKMLLMQ